MTRAQLKDAAKAQIKGNIGILFVVMLIVSVLSTIATFVLSIVPVAGSLAATFIVTPAFLLSIARVYLNLYAGKKPEVKDAFCGFDDFWTAAKVQILSAVYVFLWSILFIIPGIIKAFSYSQAMYIIAENKGMSARKAIDESKKMMDGHKMEYFILTLSFIGWAFLAYLTFGILYIWLAPYMTATYTNYYKYVSGLAHKADAVEAPAEEAPAEEAPAAE